MNLESYRPTSKLISKVTNIKNPRFPVIDMHNHLGNEFGGGWIDKPISELIDTLDQAGVVKYVDLDGGWGEDILETHIEKLKVSYPDRFQVFGGINWEKWKELGDSFPDWVCTRLHIQARLGAQGLKIWKIFGLHVQDQQNNLVRVNDPRLDPIWHEAGVLKLPIMIHVADPVAFFDPIDAYNERWEELNQNPDWQFTSPPYPSFMSIIEDMADLIRRNKNTIFIGAHVGCYAENLEWVSRLLDDCSNFFVDISARISELGRQPYSSKRFFMDYQDRILFGSDFGPDLDAYKAFYRFLETDDEYFNYGSTEVPQQGRWNIYGINLPDNVLQKVYHLNAQKILLPG